MTIQNSDVKKVLDVKNVSIAMVGLLFAVALAAASSFIKVENDTLTMSMLVAGGVLFFFSLYIIMNNNHKLIYGPTGSTLKHYVVYIDPSQRPAAEQKCSVAVFIINQVNYRLLYSKSGRMPLTSSHLR